MKLIICGPRDYHHLPTVVEAFTHFVQASGWPDEIVEGGCTGVDKLAKSIAIFTEIPLKSFPANWNLHGKAAGPIRNKEMAKYADALLAIWVDGGTKGTTNMVKQAEKLGLPVMKWEVESESSTEK